MLYCPSPAIPRGGRRWLGASLPLVLLVIGPSLAIAQQAASPFETRGPAAQDPSLADRVEVVRLLGNQPPLTGYDLPVWDCQ